MKTLLLILFLVFTASAQCRNLSILEYAENRRFSLPAKITNYDGQKISVSIVVKDLVLITEFPVDDQTEFPIGFQKNYKQGTYIVVYCADTRTVLWAQKSIDRFDKYETKADQRKRKKL